MSRTKVIRRHSVETRARALVLVDQGKQQKDVAKELGIGERTMHQWVRERKEGRRLAARASNKALAAYWRGWWGAESV